MNQQLCFIALVCTLTVACSGGRQDVVTTPPAEPIQDLEEASSPADAAPDSLEAASPTPSTDAATRPSSGLNLDTGSTLTGRVSDLSGLVTDLGGQITETEIVVELPADVLFDFDKADIRQDAVPTLEKLARLVGSTQSQSVTINGHTDAEGTEDFSSFLNAAPRPLELGLLKRALMPTGWRQ